MRLEIPTPGNSITDYLRRSRDEHDVVSFLRAVYCIWRQGRLAELFYGLYCAAIARPSTVQSADVGLTFSSLLGMKRHLVESTTTRTRHELVNALHDRYAVGELPNDFEGCRTQAIAQIGSRLVLGEYGRNTARIAVVSRTQCEVFSPYERTRGVRHVHLVYPTGLTDEVFITTGDATKVLDRMTIADGAPRLIVRHRARLAGYTAAAYVGGKFYFGTDFSGRPNYIETLQGEKHFLPAGAYSKWVGSLTVLGQRYLVVMSHDMGGREDHTVTLFDALEQTFVLCKPWTELFRGMIQPKRPAASAPGNLTSAPIRQEKP